MAGNREGEMIEFEGVSRWYGSTAARAVDGVSLEIRAGELLAMVGESGSGKTTLLKMINRLIEPSEGVVRIDGEPTTGIDAVGLRRRIGYVVQGVGLLPHWTIEENVATVPGLLGWRRKETDERVGELMDMVGLPREKFGKRRPAELSGGQAQRAGIARALAGRPKILLMDEPFGALDPVTRDRLQEEVKALHQSLGLTTVMVTHDLAEATRMGDRMAVMKDGKLLRLGTPEEVWKKPGNEYVSRLLESPKRQARDLARVMGAGS